MAADRVDHTARVGDTGATRRWVLGGLLGTALVGLGPRSMAAQGEIMASGNGGVATATADGSAVVIGDVNSGGNVGNAIAIGDTSGSVAGDGGDVANVTTIGIVDDGGIAIANADASGGLS